MTETSQAKASPRPILFTDLDGTLLDFRTYSFAESVDALRQLQQHGIPVIFTSSKTFLEQLDLQQRLGLREPFIVENGSAIAIPEGYFPFAFDFDRKLEGYCLIERSIPADRILAWLREIREELHLNFTSFSEMPAEEARKVTGLDEHSARNARKRDYSETLVAQWTPQQWQAFLQALKDRGLACHPGGRFYTVTSAEADKGRAVRLLSELYRRQFGHIRTFGVGDSKNDLPMLRAVDEAYLVQRPDGTWVDATLPGVRRIEAIGPRGWARLANELLRRFTGTGTTGSRS